jgi:hypothetical protein
MAEGLQRIDGVKRAKEIHAASADAKTYSENLKAAFPELRQAAFVDLSASYLYAAPHCTRFKSTNRASRVGGTTRQGHRAGE